MDFYISESGAIKTANYWLEQYSKGEIKLPDIERLKKVKWNSQLQRWEKVKC